MRKPLEVSQIKQLMAQAREWQAAKKKKRAELRKQQLQQQLEFCKRQEEDYNVKMGGNAPPMLI